MADKSYGVFIEGTDVWVVTASPYTTGSADQAATYTEADAMGVAAYLVGVQGEQFRVGRPGDRKPS